MTKQNAIVKEIINKVGIQSQIVVKKIVIGEEEQLNANLIYIAGQANTNVINRDVLNPLLFKINEKLELEETLPQYLCKKYIPSDTKVVNNIDEVVENLKNGSTAIIIDYIDNYIIINTVDGEYRSISDPINEYAVKGTRESFVENIETNISIISRRIKGDSSLTIEKFKIGKRAKKDLAIMYIKDLVNEAVLNEVKEKINSIDVDDVGLNGMLEQYMEENTYSIFPQTYITERPDIVQSNLMEGRLAIIMNGTPHVITAPALFTEFFAGIEDYTHRLWVSNFTRVLRYLATIVIITLPSIYLTFVKFNVEIIPLKFITPIVESRVGIALPPFFEILSMEIIVEILREGGIRLPAKIAQTLSIVGGIIIGDTAIKAKIVSPPTLLIVGITVVATFVIPNYEMSLSVRLLRFIMLILSDFMGIFGIAIGCFLILAHLYKLDSFGVPYFSLNKEDMKDLFIRVPVWKMKTRPKDIANKDIVRQENKIK